MTSEIRVPEQDLIAEADRVRHQVTNAMKKLAKAGDIIERLRSENDPQAISTLLAIHSGLGLDDIRILETISSLRKDSDNSNGLVSPEGVRALAMAPKELRAEIARFGDAGHTIGKSGIERLDRLQRVGDVDLTGARARRSHLESLAARVSASAIDKVETLAEELLHAVWDFMRVFTTEPEDMEEWESIKRRPGYSDAHAHVAKLAGALVEELDRVLGPVGPADPHSDGDSPEQRLNEAYKALARLASGRFGHPFGFGLDETNPNPFDFELDDAIGYLCPSYVEESNLSALETSRNRKLTLVEFGAGCGGMSLGLMSAGFHHWTLFESIGKRVKTLRANWPEWSVIQKDLPEVTDEFLERIKDVDLLAGTLPRELFSRTAGEDDRTAIASLFQHVLRAVGAAKPRAILLGLPISASYKPSLAHVATIVDQLTALGYTIDVVRLQLKHFGLPQSGERIAIVGIRDDQRDAFVPPILAQPVERGVSEVLGDLVILHETPEALKDSIPAKSPQYWYDRWASYWRAEYKKKRLPTIPVSTEKRMDRLGFWREGFDSSSIAENAPSVEDIGEDQHYKPKLTVQMAARAQGFPETWTYHAINGGNMDMIAEAFPPILAKALGLRLYSLLTGNPIDLDAALAKPIVEEHKIGRFPISLNSPPLPAALRKKVGTLQRMRYLQRCVNYAVETILRRPDSEESEILILKEKLKSKPTDRVTVRDVEILREFVGSLVAHRIADEHADDAGPG